MTAPTSTTLPSEDPGVKRVLRAVYDAAIRAPLCDGLGSGCDSGSLLNGSGGIEANQPNTISNACADGSGRDHAAAINSIQIRTGDETQLAAGKFTIVESEVFLTVPRARIRLYYTTDARNPVWKALGNFDVEAGRSGKRITLAGFALPGQGTDLHAVRVAFSSDDEFIPPCATGQNDDNDDLVFRVR